MGFTEADLKGMGLRLNPKTKKYEKIKENKSTQQPKLFSNGNEFEGDIWISGHVPSLKNNKQIWFKYAKTHLKGAVRVSMKGLPARPYITASKNVKEYQKDNARQFKAYRETFLNLVKDLPKPYLIEFAFVRKTKAGFDFNNANHLITDMMNEHDWIEDDDMANIIPIPRLKPPFHFVNKNNPGVWISVKKYHNH